MATEKMEIPQKRIFAATLKNSGIARMDVERFVNWTVKPARPPPSIPPRGVVKVNDLVRKGAVIYTGHNVVKCPVSWVLAWDAPEVIMPGAGNKVYVTCGLKSKIDSLTDAEILERLELSSDKSMAADPISITTVDSQMVDIISVLPGRVVDLDANFGILI